MSTCWPLMGVSGFRSDTHDINSGIANISGRRFDSVDDRLLWFWNCDVWLCSRVWRQGECRLSSIIWGQKSTPDNLLSWSTELIKKFALVYQSIRCIHEALLQFFSPKWLNIGCTREIRLPISGWQTSKTCQSKVAEMRGMRNKSPNRNTLQACMDSATSAKHVKM